MSNNVTAEELQKAYEILKKIKLKEADYNKTVTIKEQVFSMRDWIELSNTILNAADTVCGLSSSQEILHKLIKDIPTGTKCGKLSTCPYYDGYNGVCSIFKSSDSVIYDNNKCQPCMKLFSEKVNPDNLLR